MNKGGCEGRRRGGRGEEGENISISQTSFANEVPSLRFQLLFHFGVFLFSHVLFTYSGTAQVTSMYAAHKHT